MDRGTPAADSDDAGGASFLGHRVQGLGVLGFGGVGFWGTGCAVLGSGA